MTRSEDVIILDPGIKGPLGHHPPANRLLKNHFAQRGCNVRILVSKDCDEDVATMLNAKKAVTPSTYGRPPTGDIAAALKNTNHQVCVDLERAIPTCDVRTRLIIHTASPWHLLGVARWARTIEQQNLVLRIVFRFPSDFSPFENLQGPVYKQASHEALQRFFSTWKDLSVDTKFFADTDQAVREYGALSGEPVLSIAMPIDFPEHVDTAGASINSPPRYLLLGALRQEKGLKIVADLVEAYASGGGSGTIVIQAPQFVSDAMWNKLDAFENVQVLDQAMPAPEFLHFISTGDVVLMPYEPDQYRERSSQIFLEALGMGKPVIVTEETWMHTELDKFDAPCGVIASHSGQAFAEAMLNLESDLPGFSTAAQSIAPLVRGLHNAPNFLKALEA